MEIKELIERCKQGNEAALGELYKVYSRKMRGICRRYIKDEDTINDVLHDAFIVIFTSLDKLRDESKAESWMMSITRNVASKYKEHQKAFSAISIEDTNEFELLPITENESDIKGVPLAEVIKLIDKLPEGYRQVFRLSVFKGMTHKEIAAMLDIEPHSSSSQLARAKKMLRKKMQQYWAVLLLFIIPFVCFFLRYAIMEDKSVVAKQKHRKALKKSQTEQIIHEPINVHHSSRHRIIATDSVHSVVAQTIDSVMLDTLSNVLVQETNVSDTIVKDSIQTIHNVELQHNEIADLSLQVKRKANSTKWSFEFAYAGGYAEQNINRPYGFTETPMISPTGESPSPVTFENWSDYAAYLSEIPDDHTLHARSIIMNIALNNANQPELDKIIRVSHHYMPTIWSIAVKYRFNNHIGLESGVNYSHLKSDFEMGSEGNIIREQQSIHYLGIPVKSAYNIYNKKTWTIYGSLGLTMEIPVYSSLDTNYYLHGKFESSDNTSIHAPWLWSIGAGLGLQYNLTNYIGIFTESNVNYYIPSSSSIETYRTEHPFMFSIPIGIRFTW